MVIPGHAIRVALSFYTARKVWFFDCGLARETLITKSTNVGCNGSPFDNRFDVLIC
jgi:hypothetical protein